MIIYQLNSESFWNSLENLINFLNDIPRPMKVGIGDGVVVIVITNTMLCARCHWNLKLF